MQITDLSTLLAAKRKAQPAPTGRLTLTKSPILPTAKDAMSIRFGNTAPVGDSPDYTKELKNRGVLIAGGAGTMGRDIALTHLNGGVPVSIQDRSAAVVDSGVQYLETMLRKSAAQGRISSEEAEEKIARIKDGFTPETFDQIPNNPGPAYVIEAIYESFDAKKELFQKLNSQLAPDAILATNTSSLSVDALAEASGRPDRFIGLHFFLPAYKNKLVEIIPGKKTSAETIEKTKTSAETIEKTKALVRAIGKTPIVCQDTPGFGVNRMLVPMMNEGIKMWEEFVAQGAREYEKMYGQPPSEGVMANIKKRAATTIEYTAKEILWPTYSKKPEVSGLLLGPFSGLNMKEYMGIMGEITQILHKGLGDAYKPADTILKKSDAFFKLRKDNPPDFEARFKALQQPLGGPESVDMNLVPVVKDRLTGLLIGVAMQLLDKNAISPEDLNRGMQIGTQWELSPFEMINKIGTQKALALVEAYAKTNPQFEVSAKLKELAAINAHVPLNYVDSRVEGSTQFITINKPQRLNALDEAMLDSIKAAVESAENNPAVNTLVFESNGKHFVSGADLPALLENLKGKSPVKQAMLFRNLIKKGFALNEYIANCKKVTVAKVNGTALGGGAELALACDYTVASEKATFGLPEVLYGIYPAWGGTERLPKKIGKTMSKFMILEGGLFKKGKGPAVLNGQQAYQLGLADKLINSADLDTAVSEACKNGEFSEKRKSQFGDHLEAATEARIANTPFADKFKRYKTATLEDLMANELKALCDGKAKAAYEPVLELALNRIENSDSWGKSIRLERDILTMLMNQQRVDAYNRQQARAQKQ